MTPKTPAPVRPPTPPTKPEPMRMRAFRCDDDTWDRALAQAAADGLDLSEVLRHYLRGYGSKQT